MIKADDSCECCGRVYRWDGSVEDMALYVKEHEEDAERRKSLEDNDSDWNRMVTHVR